MISFAIILVLLAGAGVAYWRWRRGVEADLAEGAAIEWRHYQDNEPDFVSHLDEPAFAALYTRVNEPRFPGYALAALTTFVLALPVIFALLAGVQLGLDAAGVTPEPVDTAERLFLEDGKLIFFRETPPEAALYYIRDLAGFYYFFGVLFSWLAIFAFFMRRYHARRPGYLRDEIIRARE